MKFSIIIPTLNRSASLKITLDSLLALNYPPQDYEILIVDNGSKDNTREVAANTIEFHPAHEIGYHYESLPGNLSARHKGALRSKGDILIFVDDDIQADPGWLTAVAEAFGDPKTHLVGGKNLPKYESTPPDWLDAFWYRNGALNQCFYLSLVDFGDKLVEINPIYVWSLNLSIRRQTLFEVGGFHPDYIPKPFQRYQGDGDTGLAWKVAAKGLKVMYHPRALVYHVIPECRLRVDYFRERMFFAGVCDSYTTIRKNRGITSDWKMQSPFPQIKRLWRRMAGKLSADPYAEIKQRVREAWLEGYAFHQDEVRKDPELLKWVLKEDYWNYRYGSFLGSNNSMEEEASS
ncbi:MAG: glycosyltransferase family 2 protein [Desulfomonilaceae bacterium]